MLAITVFAAAPICTAMGQEDVVDVRDKEYRLKQHRQLRYNLIAAKELGPRPDAGWGLLVVMPGGDGGDEFTPFVKRIYQYAAPDSVLVLQLIAPKWNPKQEIVWPTEASNVRRKDVAVEEFVRLAVEDVASRTKVDHSRIFALAWSSGGPAAYAATLAEGSPLTGAMVAMSVFRPDDVRLQGANGKRFFLWHSPDDRVCPYWMVRKARDTLGKHGASVTLETYAGGHGWRGDVFGAIRRGVQWLGDAPEADKTPAEPEASGFIRGAAPVSG